MNIGEGDLNRLAVIRALPNACGANMLCRAVSSNRYLRRGNRGVDMRSVYCVFEHLIFMDLEGCPK